MSLLEVRQLTKNFGGLTAVDHVDFTVEPGQIKAVIGPNGAGKSSMINLISGFHKPDRGEVLFEGKSITALPPHTITQLGVARTFQRVRLFPEMTVLEHVMAGSHCRRRAELTSALLRRRWMRDEEADTLKCALDVLRLVRLEQHAAELATNLPFGKQRMVEIARALATAPRLLLFDEPAGGLSPYEIEELDRLIRTVRDRGTTVVLIEHRMSLVMSVSDEIVVLNFGKKIAEGTPGEVQDNRDVIEAYLGTVRISG